MEPNNYRASRAFVRKMRFLAAHRDIESIQDADRQIREWLCDHPDDITVGTALEEFNILEEAAQIIGKRDKAHTRPSAHQVA